MAAPEMTAEMARELVRALEVSMSTEASQILRQEAYTAIEQFKECSPYAAQVGLFLIHSENAQSFIIHFGYQLMENCVKYRWNHLSQPEKLFIKENSMRLLVAGTQKEIHVKDALSRIIVEMVKREWPQQWPSLLAELNIASVQGTIQAEIVLLVFLRLCEDVAVLQTLESTQRRKDIYQTLTTNMTDIFSFLLQLITHHVEMFQKQTPGDPQAQSHSRVVQTGLTTLSSFVEWVNLTHITSEKNMLLPILCMLLEEEAFQIHSVECLLQVVSRRGPLEERKLMLEWLDLRAMRFMLAAADNVSAKSLNETNYLFLKKLTQVLTGLAAHFCSLWGKEDPSQASSRSEHLDMYLSVMLTFSRHPSLSMVHYANSVWSLFFKHQLISRDPVFHKYIPHWVETTAPKIIRVAYPASRIPTTDQDTAAILDFDSEEEFCAFFHKTRTELLDTFRKATDVAPYVTYTYVEKWFRTVLEQSVQELAQETGLVNGNGAGCTSMVSPLHAQWDAMANLLDRVVNRLVHLESHVRPSTVSGLQLLELCLGFNPSDPLILSVLLSCISALFVFLSMATAEQSVSILPRVLDKIFAAAVFNPVGQTKENRSRAVKNVRRHAGALLVKLGQRYPLLLLPLFDQIHATVQQINRLEQLSKMEQVTLQEALLLICNHFNDYNKQSQFVAEVLSSATEPWLQMAPNFRTAEALMSYVGLDKPPVEPSSEDINGQNRSQMVYSIHLFFSVVIRSTWPEDPDRAARGGFVVDRTSSGNPIHRNPAAPHIIPLLSNILTLVKTLNALWTPEALTRLSPGYLGAHQMLDTERANLLGIPGTGGASGSESLKQNPLERMQQFLHTMLETCCHVLGNAGPSMGRDLYDIPHLGPALIDNVFTNLQYIPDYRLRPIIRTFLRNFISSCPKQRYEDLLLPVLGVFMPYMLTRLTKKWEYLSQLRNETGGTGGGGTGGGTTGLDEENMDTQEVLEEKLNSLMTREYTEILKICLVGGGAEVTSSGVGGASQDGDAASQDNAMDQDDKADSAAAHRAVNQVFTEAVSELGVLLLRTETTCQVVLLTLLRLLTWNDSSASLKSAGLTHSVIRLLVADDSLNPLIVTHILTNVLQALQIHGQYEPIQGILLTLGAQLYEMLRPKFPCVLDVMMQIPNVNQQDLQKLDEKIHNTHNHSNHGNHRSNKVDKATRDLFRKITASLIGRNMSQLFKKEVKIMDLPKLTPMSRPRKGGNDNIGDITTIGENNVLGPFFSAT